MAPLLLAGLSLLPKLPDLWAAIAGLFGKQVPDSVETAGKLAGELIEGITGGTIPPAQQVELRGLLYRHEEEIKRLTLDEQQMYLLDVQSARTADVEKTKATGKRDIAIYALAWLVVGAFFVLTGLLMRITLPPENIGPINQLFGAISTGFGVILSYFYGSSKGSADKSKLIEDLQIRNGK